MFATNKLWLVPKDALNDDLLDQMDGISPKYEGEKHIHPSKYECRQSIARQICDALENKFVCSICGNGATSFAKQLMVFVKAQGLFHIRIAMVTVSQNPNLREIQNAILQQIQKRKIDDCILILDGLWWEMNGEDFKAIGIPSPSRTFRIVFTSRNEEMCKKIGSHLIFHINFLEDEEAWDLFRKTAGKSIVDLDIEETARMILDECDGFRIPILTIASALKDKPRNVWKYSLNKLQNLNGPFISQMEKEKVFLPIHLSYDLLNDKEAQVCFHLCCLFPEDFNVPIEDLVMFGKGLQLFENVVSMCQARDRVECIIHKLKNSFLILDGDEDDFVKVHSMCRDFGIAMFFKSKHSFVSISDNDSYRWPSRGLEFKNSRAISIMCKTIKYHPVDLQCPNLHLLQFSCGRDSAPLPAGIFNGLINLKVLSLSIPSLSQPLMVLKNLRALCVTESISDNKYIKPRPRIGDLLGDEMQHLETFCFSTARPYHDFPREIGLFQNLRFLRFDQERLKYIPAGVLSKLTQLEELYLPQGFISWGCKEEGGDRINASLSELESLQLTSIGIGVAKGSVLAEKVVNKLTRFCVFVGSHVSPEYEFGTGGNSKKLLEVFDIDADDFRVSWIRDLVWKSESLRLKQVRSLKNIIMWECQPIENQNIEFPQWKKISIGDCKELEYLVAGQIPWTGFSQIKSLKLFGLCNLKEIWHDLHLSKIEGSCFGNLCEMQIMFCRKLQYVFPVSVASELRQLQRMEICFCDEMQEIFCREQMNADGDQVAGSSIRHQPKLLSLSSGSITKRLFRRGKQPEIITGQQQVFF